MKKFFIVVLSIIVLSPIRMNTAQARSSAESMPESTAKSIAPTLNSLGSISFFLDKNNPTWGGELVHVGEKDLVFFCLQLDASDPRLQRPIKYLRRVEITLEGEGESPQKIVGMTKLRKRLIQPDSKGCYIGEMQLPEVILPGKYQVSEVDLLQSSGHYISLREELNDFSPVGSIEVESPTVDRKPPIIEKIESKTPLENSIIFGGHRGWAEINFRVITTDLISGIQPESFHIFFKVFVDGDLFDIVEPKCRARLPNLYYDCHLYFSRAEPDLRSRTVKLVLDSISLSDRVGNEIEITRPSELKPFFEGKLLRYTFYPGKVPLGLNPETEPEEVNEEMPEEKKAVVPEENHPLLPFR
jgi:hypothetical protein